MHLVQNPSALFSQLEVNDNGIELSAVQKANRAFRLPTYIGRNREFPQSEAEPLNYDWVSGHQKCQSYRHGKIHLS